MEILLAQPVPRYQVMFVQAVVTTLSALALVLVVFVGVSLGVWMVGFKEPVPMGHFARGLVNLFALIFCLAAVTTLLSSVDRYRWRTLALGGGFMVTQLIIKVLSRLRDEFGFLRYTTIYGAYEPWWLISSDQESLTQIWLGLNGTLLLIGTTCYLLATIIFCRRDLPAPL